MEVLDFDYHPTPRSVTSAANSGEAKCFAPRHEGQTPRPPLSGWLLKRKSEGSRSRILSNSNRRYFTIDWQARQFYYSTAESNKTVSSHVAFREIASVEPLGPSGGESARGGDSDREELGGSASAPPPPVQRSNSKDSLKKSLVRIPRIPSFGNIARRGETQHGVAVRTTGGAGGGKVMELLCASKAEADEWLAALRDAMAQPGEEVGKGEASTAPGSSRRTSPSPRQTSPSPQRSDGVSGPTSPRSLGEPPEKEKAQPPSGPPSAATSQRRAFGLLPPRAPKAGSKAGSSAGASSVGGAASNAGPPPAAEPAVAAVPSTPHSARSRDGAGFPAGPSSSPIAESMPSGDLLTSPRVPVAVDLGSEAWTNAQAKAPEDARPRARYGDKQEGMSMQQRLQNMEFSDDEDDEEGALVAPVAGEPTPAVEVPQTSPSVLRSEPKIEQLESFNPPDSDDE